MPIDFLFLFPAHLLLLLLLFHCPFLSSLLSPPSSSAPRPFSICVKPLSPAFSLCVILSFSYPPSLHAPCLPLANAVPWTLITATANHRQPLLPALPCPATESARVIIKYTKCRRPSSPLVSPARPLPREKQTPRHAPLYSFRYGRLCRVRRS